MPIFRLAVYLFAFMAWVVPAGAAQAGLTDFLRQRNAQDAEIQSLLAATEDRQSCFRSKSHLICVCAKKVNKSDSRVELAVFKSLLVQARYQLARTVSKFIPETLYRNADAAASNFCEQVKGENANYKLAGVESSTFKDGVQLFAVATIPLQGLPVNIEAISRSKQFSRDYCAYLFPRAKSRYEAGDYQGALEILKEAHDLQWARADAYIMAAHSFVMIGENEEASKIATEVLALLQPQLTSGLAEDLGNILLGLGKDEEAKQAFDIAISRFEP